MGVLSYACRGCRRRWPVTRDTAAGALGHTSHQEFRAVTAPFSLDQLCFTRADVSPVFSSLFSHQWSSSAASCCKQAPFQPQEPTLVLFSQRLVWVGSPSPRR